MTPSLAAPDPIPAHLLPRRYQSAGRARAARARRLQTLAPLLEEAARRARGSAGLRERDPVAFVHRYRAPRQQELVALLAATLAFGRAAAIAATLERVVEALGPDPTRPSGAGLSRLAPLQHRWVSGVAIRALVEGVMRVQAEAGSLEQALAEALAATATSREALAVFTSRLREAGRPRGEAETRGLRYLLSDPASPGACKRLHLFLRWMVRAPDGIDLGLWQQTLSPAELIVPLDTHVHWLARSVGLLQRKDAGWKSAEEVTWMLRGIDSVDPLRFDFALAHLGISGGCRHAYFEPACTSCPLVAACRAAR